MKIKTLVQFIDAISEWTGRLARWLCVLLIFLMGTAVFMRYVMGASTLWAYECSIIIGAIIYVLGWSYVHKHHGHIRADMLYRRLTVRGKAIIDVVSYLLLFFPLTIVISAMSVQYAKHALEINEKMLETGWLPPATPLRIIVALGIFLFTLQGIAQFIRDFYLLIRCKPL